MAGVVYICCTPVGRHILEAHMRYHNEIPIRGIINLNRHQAITKANYDSLYDIAYNNNIPIYYCEDVNSDYVIDRIDRIQPNLIIQSGWSQKFGKRLLGIPLHGCIGQHPAPLPKGRGAACINWAILEGQKKWGDSFFLMVEEYDKGPIYAQEEITIEDWNDARTVYDKVGHTSYNMIRKNLEKWYHGKFEVVPTDESKATYYKQRKPHDGEIDFSWEASKIDRYVRALTKPYPGAFFYNRGKKILVWESLIIDDPMKFKTGTFSADTQKKCLKVVTGNKTMIGFTRVQIAGRPEFAGDKFFNYS